MVVKGKDVIGLNIVTINDGSIIETVDDIAYNPTSQRVEALLVSSGGLFSSVKAIHMDEVRNIGEDAVIVHDASAIKPVDSIDDTVHSISDSNKFLVLTNVLTTEGKDLGTVSDLHFDSATGAVDSLEVSQGAFGGKRFVKPSDIVTIGKDATIVSAYTEEKFEQQAQESGMRGAINNVKHKADETADNFKAMTMDTGERLAASAQLSINETKENDMSGLTDKLSGKAKQTAGNLTGDDKLKAEGKIEETKGDLKEKTNQALNSASDKLDELKNKVQSR